MSPIIGSITSKSMATLLVIHTVVIEVTSPPWLLVLSPFPMERFGGIIISLQLLLNESPSITIICIYIHMYIYKTWHIYWWIPHLFLSSHPHAADGPASVSAVVLEGSNGGLHMLSADELLELGWCRDERWD